MIVKDSELVLNIAVVFFRLLRTPWRDKRGVLSNQLMMNRLQLMMNRLIDHVTEVQYVLPPRLCIYRKFTAECVEKGKRLSHLSPLKMLGPILIRFYPGNF